eukprot:4806003-Prymnesium_polylepis.1
MFTALLVLSLSSVAPTAAASALDRLPDDILTPAELSAYHRDVGAAPQQHNTTRNTQCYTASVV